MLKTISNISDKCTYVDKDINYNTKYKYFVVAKSKISNNTTTTNIKCIEINKNYNQLLDRSCDYSWTN